MHKSSRFRYLKDHFGTISLEEIDNLELSIGFKLPKDYRDFLMRENGGIPNEGDEEAFKVIFGIYDGCNDLSLNWDDYRDELQDHLLPIGENLNEDLVLLDLNTGKIEIDGEVIADGINQFLEKYFIPFVSDDTPTDLIDDWTFS